MAYANGRLPKSALAPITKAANGEQAYLRKDAARAFMAMNAESERRFGVTLRVTSARVAYRPFADQEFFWDLYQHHGGALAAVPGTSNHGLGLAIDLATAQMRKIVDQIGAKYGFAKKWSDAPTEWWHIKWRAGTYKAVEDFYDAWQGYTVSEKRWIQEYDHLLHTKKDPERRKVLRRVMTQQRKKIWSAAKKSGWNKQNRRKRYDSLLARTK
jgi:hypothetical protein